MVPLDFIVSGRRNLLHAVCLLDEPELVEILLKAGHDHTLTDLDGCTPLELAVLREEPSSKLVETLLRWEADPDHMSWNSDLSLIARLVLEQDLLDRKFENIASQDKRTAVFMLLLQYGADTESGAMTAIQAVIE